MVQHEERSSQVPRYELGSYTLIHDKDENHAVMQLNGLVILPIGTHLELVKPDKDVYVVGVRLLAPVSKPEGDGAVYLCLDVSKDKPGLGN